ncbi:MAG: FAD-dependent oxidoreductase [Acidimicrobiales bacterium]
MVTVDGVSGEVRVTVDDLDVLAVGDHGSVPHGSRHEWPPFVRSRNPTSSARHSRRTEILRREGVDVRSGAKVARVEALEREGAARLHLERGATVQAERLLVAVGRRADTDGLGLDAAGVASDRGFIVTDDHLATAAPGVWAVGDAAGKLQFTAADEMGRIAAGNALSRRPPRRFHPEWIPSVTFTDPEVARVGLTEAEGAERGARVAWVRMAEVDRAVEAGATDGLVKLVAAPHRLLGHTAGGRLLGWTVVAAPGGEMIAEAALALRTRMFTARLAQTVHAYPTWSSGCGRRRRSSSSAWAAGGPGRPRGPLAAETR